MVKEVKKTQKKNVSKDANIENSKEIKKNIKSNQTKKKEIAPEIVTRDTVEEKIKPIKIKLDKETKKNKNRERMEKSLNKIDNNRFVIIAGIAGFLVATLLFRCILWPDRIATLKDGTQPIAKLDKETITANDLYDDMKNYYSVSIFLNEIDDIILSKKYPENDEMKSEINNTAEYYYSSYEKSYGYSKEDFLSKYGFASENDFIDSLRLDYRRNKYYDKYTEKQITEKQIKKYYDDEVFGDVDSKHILVAIEEDGLKDEEAKKLANEIIAKLNKGTSWDDVVKEYKDKITTEELGYNAFNANLEAAYLKEMKDLTVESYSKTPVLTSYGYHIVYKIAQKDKAKLDDVKDDIIEILVKEKKSADSNLYYKALIAMRSDAKLEFVDTKLAEEYNKLVNQYK